ncbi:Calcium-dependent protease precursor [Vibrio aerogenes CECT 7868]|uniref:Calcium-dependent protease n=1 Tax=Vibrio aerogenes CECT 7868 TaxID=1216006 RepID=A0A1M6BZ48_9VIBR|nr:S8 family serine peptidase [Vibrio aerogenes]SHI54079.1 Calcium-dependent protease precursor [Vibrio aerogenes CECT 7868]
MKKCLLAILIFIFCPVAVIAAQLCHQTYGIESFDNAQQGVTLRSENRQTYATFSFQNKQDQLLQFRFPVCVAPRLIVTTRRSANLNRSALHSAIPEITAIESLLVTPEIHIWLIRFRGTVARQQRLAVKMQHLNHEPGVIAVQPDILIEAHPTFGQTQGDQNRRIEQIFPSLPAIWQQTTGKGIRIAVIDDGFELQHRDLAGVHTKRITPENRLSAPETNFYGTFHGTRVAGLIFARHNQLDIHGIAPDSTFIPIPIRGSYTSSLIRLFSQAEQQQADIINVSWYLPWLMAPLKDTIHFIAHHGRQGKGTAIVVASGNHAYPDTAPYSLAGMRDVLTVAAVDIIRHKPTRAQGRYIDLAAPAGMMSLISGNPNHRTSHRFSGSSAATPVISGISALILSRCPQLTRKQLFDLLLHSTDTPAPRLQPFLGAGMIHASKVWQQLQQIHCPSAKTPDSPAQEQPISDDR